MITAILIGRAGRQCITVVHLSSSPELSARDSVKKGDYFFLRLP